MRFLNWYSAILVSISITSLMYDMFIFADVPSDDALGAILFVPICFYLWTNLIANRKKNEARTTKCDCRQDPNPERS